jgi:predicted hotdog family 3-hydroxylacyl-ACP dehydratase
MLDRTAIAARIPHAGRMCLLDRVLHWDERGIRCTAVSHRDKDNPLLEAGRLPVWAGIEYAAQAAAVHGALVRPQATLRNGVLAAMRNVNACCERLDSIEGELMFEATLLHSDPAGGIYSFEAHAVDALAGRKLLLSGQFTLMYLDARHGKGK